MLKHRPRNALGVPRACQRSRKNNGRRLPRRADEALCIGQVALPDWSARPRTCGAPDFHFWSYDCWQRGLGETDRHGGAADCLFRGCGGCRSRHPPDLALETSDRRRDRDAAYAWGLCEDVADVGRFIETFTINSWLEVMQHRERVTDADEMLETSVRHLLTETPRVTASPRGALIGIGGGTQANEVVVTRRHIAS